MEDDPRCPATRDGAVCCWRPGHGGEPPGLHYDEILGKWAAEGSAADDWLNLIAERSARSTTDASTTRRTGSTVRP